MHNQNIDLIHHTIKQKGLPITFVNEIINGASTKKLKLIDWSYHAIKKFLAASMSPSQGRAPRYTRVFLTRASGLFGNDPASKHPSTATLLFSLGLPPSD